jgi:hypothetical protein
MTAVVFNHLRQERLNGPKVSKNVDVEDISDYALRVIHECVLWHLNNEKIMSN